MTALFGEPALFNWFISGVLDQQNCVVKCKYKLLRGLKRKFGFKKCFCFYCAGAHLDSIYTLLPSDFMELLLCDYEQHLCQNRHHRIRPVETLSDMFPWICVKRGESPQHNLRSARQLSTIKAVMPLSIKGSSVSLRPLVFLKTSLTVSLDVPCLNGLRIKDASRWHSELLFFYYDLLSFYYQILLFYMLRHFKNPSSSLPIISLYRQTTYNWEDAWSFAVRLALCDFTRFLTWPVI